MTILAAMFVLGLVLGFIGAGGAGTIIAILTVFFGVPMHLALGTSLSSMVFTCTSGVFSHYREHNINIRAGLWVGVSAAIGAIIGSQIAQLLPAKLLAAATSIVMLLSAALLWLRLFTRLGQLWAREHKSPQGLNFIVISIAVGLAAGLLSGLFGIGATPYIQLGLLVFLGLTIWQSVGTTLLVILPSGLLGGLGYALHGNFDTLLLLKVVAGTMLGAYIGAKFTSRVRPIILKAALVVVPTLSGLLLLFGKLV